VRPGERSFAFLIVFLYNEYDEEDMLQYHMMQKRPFKVLSTFFFFLLRLAVSALSSYRELDPQFIVVGHGSSGLMHLLWQIYLVSGETIICCPPTFSFYTTSASFCNASVLGVPRATTD